MSLLPHFRRLCDDLPAIRAQVAALESPNPEDDRMIKMAIVGYGYHQPVEAWGREEYEFVTKRRQEVEDQGPLWVEFVCLATGYLLGLYQSGGCSKREFALFEAQLPGLMWYEAVRFTSEEE